MSLESEFKRLRKLGYDPGSENSMIAAVLENRDEFTVSYAMRALRKGLGTSRCVSALEQACTYSAMDVQGQAIHAIDQFSGESALPFFRRLMVEPKHREKMTAADMILKYGDQSDIPVMNTRLRQVLARPKRIWGGIDTPRSTVLWFLEQFVDESPVCARAISWARERLRLLHEDERMELIRCVPGLEGGNARPWIVVVQSPGVVSRRLAGVVYRGVGPLGVAWVHTNHRWAGANLRRWSRFAKFIIGAGEKASQWVSSHIPEGWDPRRTHLIAEPAYASIDPESTRVFLEAAEKEEPAILASVLKVLRDQV